MEAGPPMTAQSQSLHFDGLCRLIGEVKQDCNLTLRLAKRLGADASVLGHSPQCAFPRQNPNGSCQVFKSPSSRLH